MHEEILNIFNEFYKPKGLEYKNFKIDHRPKLIDPNGKTIRESFLCYDFLFVYKGRAIPIPFMPNEDIKTKFENVFKDLRLDI